MTACSPGPPTVAAMSKRTPLIAAALVAALAAAGCGGSSSSSSTGASAPNPNAPEKSPPGDIPDNQAFVAYSPPGAGYSVKVPEGWARSTSGGAVTFTDKLNSVRMQSLPAAQAKRAAQIAGGKMTTVTRSAGKTTLTTYTKSSAPDPVTGKVTQDAVQRYVYIHGNRGLVLTLTGAKGADNVDPWKIVTNSVRWSG
jgi:hypothetical protein